jgi:hypothetical protein
MTTFARLWLATEAGAGYGASRLSLLVRSSTEMRGRADCCSRVASRHATLLIANPTRGTA